MTLGAYQQAYEYDYKGDQADAIIRVGGNGDFEAKSQYDFMLKQGLKPFHHFLDLGCGCLRGTIRLIDYLDEARFHGADVSQGLLTAAEHRIKTMGIKNTPMFIRLNSFSDLRNFFTKFDYILSVSLLTHLLPDAVSDLFGAVKDVLAENGVWYFSIIPSLEADHVGDVSVSQYKKEFLGKLAQEKGLLIKDWLADHPNPAPDFQVIKRTNQPYIGQWMLEAVHA